MHLLGILGIALPPLVYPVYVAACHRYAAAYAKPLLAFRRPHNVLLALYSAWVVLRVLWIDPSRWTSPHNIICKASVPDSTLEWSWYASKFWEWIDTAMLIAAGIPLLTISLS